MRSGPFIRYCAILLALCGTAALFGQGFFRMTEEQEIELGKHAAAQVEKDQPILHDPAVDKFLNDLGQKLVQKSGRPGIQYTFHVVDTTDVNAFALPGGYIFVNRGLIETASNESELAGVLGHEIGHVVAKHGVEQARRAGLVQAGLRALGGLLGDSAAADIGRQASEMVTAGVFMKFSRDAERQADRLGAQNVYDTGFNPQGMVSFFEKLASLVGQSQSGGVEKFFASHPNPQDRAANISDLLRTFGSSEQLATDATEFHTVQTQLASLPRTDPKKWEADKAAAAQAPPAKTVPELPASRQQRDRAIAARFAPVIHQGLGPSPRHDFITNFDFDGDWRGDNNWTNSASAKFPLKGYVYFSVSETPTHFFIHYALFHPRDYKGGPGRGVALSEAIRLGVELGGQYDPTGRADEAILSHENDLEGALVVAAKNGEDPSKARLYLVETLAHNAYLHYAPPGSSLPGAEPLEVTGGTHPHLFAEPRGHGIEAWKPDGSQCKPCESGTLIYSFTGTADSPEDGKKTALGYDLLSIYTTLWPHAQAGQNETYGLEHDYGTVKIFAVDEKGQAGEREVKLGVLGSSFNGQMGGRHMARPPWGWFDGKDKDRLLGEWFWQPAEVIRRHWDLGSAMPVAYEYQPYLGVGTGSSR